jgi:hypothetical protein
VYDLVSVAYNGGPKEVETNFPVTEETLAALGEKVCHATECPHRGRL